jgi:IS1 family transposase
MLKRSSIILVMNKLTIAERSQVIRCLVEGNSIRSTERITGVTKKAIIRLLVQAGEVCRIYQDGALRNLACKRVQCDEIWSFCGAKEKNTSPEKKLKGWGDVWTWTAIDADSKLVLSWLVGNRDASCATRFMHDVASRIKNRIQLTSDGYKAYFDAIEDAFVGEIDYAILVKIYGRHSNEAQTRYSPAECIGLKIEIRNGDPDPGHISTSYVERQNLSMRMHMRRFTRLTNAFSKKVQNHASAVALHFMYYNFCRVHQTLRVTPAMEAGIETRVWEIEDIVALVEAQERVKAKTA